MELKHSLEDFINKCKWGYGIKSYFQTCGVHFKSLFVFMEENVDLQS